MIHLYISFTTVAISSGYASTQTRLSNSVISSNARYLCRIQYRQRPSSVENLIAENNSAHLIAGELMNEVTTLREENATFVKTVAAMRLNARGIIMRVNTILTNGTPTQLGSVPGCFREKPFPFRKAYLQHLRITRGSDVAL
jgi:hypothetical protein